MRLLIGLISFLTLATSCSSPSSDNRGSESVDAPSQNLVDWTEPSTLISVISQELSSNCPSFSSTTARIQFTNEYPASNLLTFDINGATLHLYLDGAFNPDVEDDLSLSKYYEEWGCKSDTLYISELRFSDKDFNGTVSPTQLFDCVDRYLERPDGLIITCADANMRVESIVWSSWNTVEATGTGVFSENDCNPDCASGTVVEQDAVIRLGSVRRDSSGKNVFTEIEVETAKAQQSGGYFDTYELYYRG